MDLVSIVLVALNLLPSGSLFFALTKALFKKNDINGFQHTVLTRSNEILIYQRNSGSNKVVLVFPVLKIPVDIRLP